MLPTINSIATETAKMKLILKQKKFQYEIVRLEYKIFLAVTKLDNVNFSISESEETIVSLNASISVSGKGKVMEKLVRWKTKEEYKLFKLHLRKAKIDVCKIVINQSKLSQTKEALLVVEKSIETLNPTEEKTKELTTSISYTSITPLDHLFFHPQDFIKNKNNPLSKSIDEYLRKALKMAS